MEKIFSLNDTMGIRLADGMLVGESTSRIEFYNVRRGTKILVEAAESGKPLLIDSSYYGTESDWKLSTGTTSEFNGSNQIKIGTFGKIVKSYHDTAIAHQMGELPKYLIMEAVNDGAYLTVGSHSGNKAMILEATNVPMLLRRGAYLLAQYGVRTGRHTITGKNSKLISDLLGFRFFQKIYGHGIYAIEARGDFRTRYLIPGQSVAVESKKLIAISETVEIIDIGTIHKEAKVRSAYGFDYNLILQANAVGGYVKISDDTQQPPKKPKKDKSESEEK